MIKRILYNFALIIIAVVTASISYTCKHNNEQIDGKAIDPHKAKIQINWVGHWYKEGEKEILVREIANEYEFLNQDIKINLKFPEEIYGNAFNADFGFIVDQIKKPIPDWDIIRLYGGYSTIGMLLNDTNWMEKYLIDFSQVPGFMESHHSFLNNKLYKNRFKNKFYGPYSEGQIAALFVNVEVAKKIGITVNQFDMTFDDFLSYIKAAYEYNKTHPNIIPIFEYNWGKTLTIFNMLFISLMDNTEELLDTKLTAKKLYAIEKCYQAFEELSKYNAIEKDWEQHNWTYENDKILNDSCLFFPNLTLMYSIWKMKSEEKMSKVIPCEFPVFKPSSAYIGGYTPNWVVLKNSPHKDEAVKLLMYWCTPGVAEKWVRISKSPSGVKGSFTTSSFGVDPFETYSYTIEKKYGGNLIKDEDLEYIVGARNKNVPLRVQEVLEGKLSAKDAFDAFKKLAVY